MTHTFVLQIKTRSKVQRNDLRRALEEALGDETTQLIIQDWLKASRAFFDLRLSPPKEKQ